MAGRTDDRRSSQYDYSNRRAGEREGNDRRDRSPPERDRDRFRDGGRDRDPDRDHDYGGRYFPDNNNNNKRHPADDRRGSQRSSNPASPREPSKPPFTTRGLASKERSSNSLSSQRSSSLNNLPSPHPRPLATKVQDEFRAVFTPLAERATLEIRNETIDRQKARFKQERGKNQSKYAEFPSVREMDLAAQKELDNEATKLKEEIKVNSDRVDRSADTFISSLIQLVATPKLKPANDAASDQSASRLDALERRFKEKEEAWARQEAAWKKQEENWKAHDAAHAKPGPDRKREEAKAKAQEVTNAQQALRISQLEVKLDSATNTISQLKEQNKSLEKQTDGLSSNLRNIMDGHDSLESQITKIRPSQETTQEKADSGETQPSLASKAENTDELQDMQASVQNLMDRLESLNGKVDEQGELLNNVDIEMIGEAFEAAQCKLPTLQKEVEVLHAAFQQQPPPTSAPAVTTADLETIREDLSRLRSTIEKDHPTGSSSEWATAVDVDNFKTWVDDSQAKVQQESKASLSNLGSKFGGMIDGLMRRVHVLETNVELQQAATGSSLTASHTLNNTTEDGADRDWNSDEARSEALKAIKDSRKSQTPTPEFASIKDEVEKLKAQLLSHDETLMRLSAQPNTDQHGEKKEDPQVTQTVKGLQTEIQSLKDRLDATEKVGLPAEVQTLNDRLGTTEQGVASSEARTKNLEDATSQSVRTLNTVQQAVYVLNARFNNLTTDHLCKTILQHIESLRSGADPIRLQGRLTETIAWIRGLEKRLEDLEKANADIDDLSNGAAGSKKRKFDGQGVNGHS